MKKTLIIIIVSLSSVMLFAQQDAMFTHYMYNTLAVNPGYAGSRDALTVTGLHRTQWVEFEGAPVTQTLTMHSPIISDNMGVGLSIITDKIGPVNTTSLYGDYAYKVRVSKKGLLSFGLKAGINVRQANLTDLDLNNGNDIVFSTNEESMYLPNFGFGLYYSTDKFYMGLSIPEILENDYRTNEIYGGTDFSSEERHYFFIAGAVYDIGKDFKFKPTTFLKMTVGAPVILDLSGTFYYRDKIWTGFMLRSGDGVGLLVGMNVYKQLSFGYSYDWSFANTTMVYNGGSHEIMVMYDFIYNNKSKIRSPRYF